MRGPLCNQPWSFRIAEFRSHDIRDQDLMIEACQQAHLLNQDQPIQRIGVGNDDGIRLKASAASLSAKVDSHTTMSALSR